MRLTMEQATKLESLSFWRQFVADPQSIGPTEGGDDPALWTAEQEKKNSESYQWLLQQRDDYIADGWGHRA